MDVLKNGKEFCDLYLQWLSANIEEYKIDSKTYRITLPFLDRNNDHTELYIIDRQDGTFLLTDDGVILNDLEFSGFDFSGSKKRRRILSAVTNAHGVTVTDNNELQVVCTLDDLPVKKHMLAQCMVKVSDMFYLSQPNVQSVFLDDVRFFLEENDVRYVPNVLMVGKSKLTSHYDFAVGKSKRSGERLIKVVNNMDQTAAKSIIFSWNDTKEMRQPDSKLYAFIQDSNKKISTDALSALKEYGIETAFWTEREKVLPALTA